MEVSQSDGSRLDSAACYCLSTASSCTYWAPDDGCILCSDCGWDCGCRSSCPRRMHLCQYHSGGTRAAIHECSVWARFSWRSRISQVAQQAARLGLTTVNSDLIVGAATLAFQCGVAKQWSKSCTTCMPLLATMAPHQRLIGSIAVISSSVLSAGILTLTSSAAGGAYGPSAGTT